MKITFRHKGDFSKTEKYLDKSKKMFERGMFDEYGQIGVEALSKATPRLTGKTAESWKYSIKRSKNSVSIIWSNTNVNDGVSIAVILQYGHGTGTGGYVEGVDYIRPAMRPVFKKIADDLWEEVTNG